LKPAPTAASTVIAKMGISSSSNDVWKQVYEQTEEALKAKNLRPKEEKKSSYTDTLSTISEDDTKETSVSNTDITRYLTLQGETLSKKSIEVVEKLWSQYDTNHDGILSSDECLSLTKDFLVQARFFLPKIIEGIVLESIKNLQKYKGYTTVASNVSDIILDSISKGVDKSLGDAIDVSKKFHGNLDENKDGRVEKQEFLRHYLAVTNSFFKPDLLQAKCLALLYVVKAVTTQKTASSSTLTSTTSSSTTSTTTSSSASSTTSTTSSSSTTATSSPSTTTVEEAKK
jgi:hypothetical protein